jgi:hypothetical protein
MSEEGRIVKMELLESELAPESILPAQVWERPVGGARLQPEKRLQIAVLADAVLTVHRLAGQERARARRLFAEVEAWFASDAADTPFTFIGICESLKFDPSYIRRGLRDWRTCLDALATQERFIRRDGDGTPQMVLPRLRRIA